MPWCFGLVIILLGSTNTIAQEIPRVSPQVVTNTLVIDQDTDAKKLKENLLYIMKNVGQDEYVAYYLILDAAVALVGDRTSKSTELKKLPSSLFEIGEGKEKSDLKNEIHLVLHLLTKIEMTGPDLIEGLKCRIKANNNSTISEETKVKAINILDGWKKQLTRACDKVFTKWAESQTGLSTSLLGNLDAIGPDSASAKTKKYYQAFKKYRSEIRDLEAYLNETNSTKKTDLKTKIESYKGLRVIRYCEITSGSISMEDRLSKLKVALSSDVKIFEALVKNLKEKNKLDDELIKKIKDMANLGLVMMSSGQGMNVSEFCSALTATLPSIMGANIEEQDRIKAVTEIVFQLQRVIENLKFKVDNNKLVIQLGNRTTNVVESLEGDTNFDLLIRTLDSLAEIVSRIIIDNVGSNHPASLHFNAIYAKIRLQAMALKDKSGFSIVLNFPVKDFIRDFEKLRSGKKDATYEYELCRRFVLEIKEENKETDLSRSLSAQFAREFYLLPMIDLIGNEILKALTTGLKDPTRFAWINNINAESGVTEFSTTVSFKMINHPGFVWEINSNFFYNSAKEDTNLPAGSTTTPLYVGSTWHWLNYDNNFEVSLVSAISGRSLTNLGKANAGMHSYLGVSLSKRWKQIIFRPFLEWEYEATEGQDRKYFHQRIYGLEVRLPKQFVFNSAFVSYKSETGGLSVGIKFPVVK